MRRLILEEWLSLDGFAEDRDGRLDFFPATETDHFSDRDQLRFLDSVDTIAGRSGPAPVPRSRRLGAAQTRGHADL
jgi:hypothetical protein